MKKTLCDHCRKEVRHDLLTEIKADASTFVQSEMMSKGLQQGLFQNLELCMNCFQEFNWIMSAFYRGDIHGKNPFEDENL